MSVRVRTITILFITLITTGCSSESTPVMEPTQEATTTPFATEAAEKTQVAETESASVPQSEAQNVIRFDEMGVSIGFDCPDGFSQNITTSMLGVYEPQAPFELPYPQNARILFTGYPGNTGDFNANGIRVFSADEINALETGALESLYAVLEGQTDHHSDFPRMAGAGSLIDAQLSPLAFRNGNGYRYLFTKSFSADPVADTTLTYMYQGVTSDDKYFVSFIMSVDAPFLAEFIGQTLTTPEEFEGYYQNVNSKVESAPGDQFTPSLIALDELISTIIILED